MNIRPYIILNGVSSQSIQGLLISELAPISKPQVRTQVETIDGRSGDIVTPLGYAAYDKEIKIGLTRNYDIDEIIAYFNSDGVVIFSNEPTKYYRYAIYEQIDFERLINFKKAEVTLHVQPFKLSTLEAEKTFNISSSPAELKIRNSGNIYSRPTLTIVGSGVVTVSLNGSQILSIELGDTEQTIIINAEAMNAYSVDKTLLNRLVSGDYDKIKLEVGQNTIGISGNVSSVKVNYYSRWI